MRKDYDEIKTITVVWIISGGENYMRWTRFIKKEEKKETGASSWLKAFLYNISPTV